MPTNVNNRQCYKTNKDQVSSNLLLLSSSVRFIRICLSSQIKNFGKAQIWFSVQMAFARVTVIRQTTAIYVDLENFINSEHQQKNKKFNDFLQSETDFPKS